MEKFLALRNDPEFSHFHTTELLVYIYLLYRLEQNRVEGKYYIYQNQSHTADALGISMVSVTRAIKKLTKMGITKYAWNRKEKARVLLIFHI